MKNINKDIQRGRGSARLAPGAVLFDPTDDSHVLRSTPLQTKAKQMASCEDLGIDPKREKSTSRKRAAKETRPI